MGEKQISLRDAEEQVRKVCYRLGLLHACFARTLSDELGDERAREIILKAIKDYSIQVGRQVKARVVAQGKGNSPENYDGDLPSYGMHDTTEWVEVDGEKRLRMRGCVMGKLWREMGEGGLGRLYCYVDIAKYMAFNPRYKLVHLKTLPDGDDYCEFAIRPTTRQERADFKNKDVDWSYIDR